MRNLKYLFVIIGLIWIIVGYAQTSKVTFTDPNKPIIVIKSSPIFTIRLQSNPTTGYSWFTQSMLGNTITLVSHTYYPPQKNRPGAAGYEEWTYRLAPEALAMQQIQLSMIYSRPWEFRDARLVRFTISIQP